MMSTLVDKGRNAFTWWARALAAWLPVRWRQLLGIDAPRLLLWLHGNEQATLGWQQGAHMQTLASVPVPLPEFALERLLPPRWSRLPRWMVLGPPQVLRRSLVLPLAAAPRLRDVAGFEIDRQTPFAAEAVAFDARLLKVQGEGHVEAELVVAPRTTIVRARMTLGEAADALAGIEVMDAEQRLLGVNLLAPTERVQRKDPFRYWDGALLAIAAVALFLAGHRFVTHRQAAVAAFAARVEQQAAQARQVAVHREQLNDLVQGTAFFARKRATQPATVDVLEELSQRVPTDTYLERLGLQGRQLQLSGVSAQAAALVAQLEGARYWRKPALSGSLQRDERSARDRFSLSMEMIGRTPDAPGAGASHAP